MSLVDYYDFPSTASKSAVLWTPRYGKDFDHIGNSKRFIWVSDTCSIVQYYFNAVVQVGNSFYWLNRLPCCSHA